MATCSKSSPKRTMKDLSIRKKNGSVYVDGRKTVTKIQLIKKKKKSQAKNSVHTLLPLFVDKYEEGQVLYIVQFSLVQSLSRV